MTHGCLPFNDTAHIKAGDYTVSAEHIVPPALALLRSILVVKPDARATLADVAAHEWLVHWRPHALREPRPRFGLTHNDPDPTLLTSLEDKFGLRSEHVAGSLRRMQFNHATATYSLLEEMQQPHVA